MKAERIVAHYRVLDRLGGGGMGEVFLAEDVRLRRPVALKQLSPQARATQGACLRLMDEARAASALVHPGIAVVYEIGEAESEGTLCPFIAMEYVPGGSLKDRIARGAVPSAEVLDVARQLADALGAAHAKGIVHRDVKPANVMLTDQGRVKVLDFGLATQPAPEFDEHADTWSADGVKAHHALAGTVAYMAPEQARGRSVDARADVFALGAVVYEMLSGRQPFVGANAVEVLDALLREDPPPIPDLDALGRALEALSRRMMAKKASERPASMAAVSEALERLDRGEVAPTTEVALRHPVAVLDFANLSGRPEDGWLGTGIAETLAADLDGRASLSVVSRDRVHDVLRNLGGGAAGDAGEALAIRLGREIEARFVVCGAFQRLGDSIRVTARLVDPVAGTVTRTAKLDGKLDGLFDLQDRVVAAVAAGLAASPRSETPGEGSRLLDAYEAYSKGLLNLRAESQDALDRALILFERAIALDPEYAAAHLGLGVALSLKADFLSSPEHYARALVGIRRALDLRPDMLEAWRELSSTLLGLGRDDEALEAAERALSLDPESGPALATRARVLFLGRADFEAAAPGFARALARNPQGGWYALQLAHCLTWLGRLREAADAARRALVLQEEFLSGRQGLLIVGAYTRLGHVAALEGRYSDALDLFEREADFARRVDHGLRRRGQIELGYRAGSAGLHAGTADARRRLEQAVDHYEQRVRLGSHDPFSGYYAACARALLGDTEGASEVLEAAARTRPAYTRRRAASEPDLASLASLERFRRLLGPWAPAAEAPAEG